MTSQLPDDVWHLVMCWHKRMSFDRELDRIHGRTVRRQFPTGGGRFGTVLVNGIHERMAMTNIVIETSFALARTIYQPRSQMFYVRGEPEWG